MFAFGFRSRCASRGKENCVRYGKDIEMLESTSFSRARKRYPPTHRKHYPPTCSPFSAYLIAPGNLWLFRARYALPRFRKGSRRACLECCRPHPRMATRKNKNHPSVANIYPWYFVGKFLESNCTVATSNERC